MSAQLHAIFMAAGRGRRMGALSDTLPKPLIPVRDGRGALAHNLDNLGKLDLDIKVTVVTGYRADDFADVVDASPVSADTIVNPQWAEFGPVRSALMGLIANQHAERIMLMNADTLYASAMFTEVTKRTDPGVFLASSDGGPEDADDVLVEAEGVLVRAARKRSAAGAPHLLSSGLALANGAASGAELRAALDYLWGAEMRTRTPIMWHALFGCLWAARTPARVLPVARTDWWEFDTADAIESFSRRPAAETRKSDA